MRARAVPGGACNHGRDGAMRTDVCPRSAKNYEPNSFGGPTQSGEPTYNGLAASGVSGATQTECHPEDDDFVQAGALYRTMSEDERERLVRRIGGSLAQVSRQEIVGQALYHFSRADSEYGARVAAAVKDARSA